MKTDFLPIQVDFTRQKTGLSVALIGSVALVLSGCQSTSVSKNRSKTTQSRSTYQPKIVKNARGVPNYHRVSRGDTVNKIASRYKISASQIIRLNRLDSAATIYPDQWLLLWDSKATNARSNSSTSASSRNTTTTRSSQPSRQATQAQANTATLPANPNRFEPTVGFRSPSQNPIVQGFNPSAGMTGVRFGGRFGDPVYPSKNGVVISVGNTATTGKTVVIRHGDSTTSIYSQLGNTNVQNNMYVSPEQVIATMGNNGFVFQIHANGKYVNPQSVF